ncbi:MAG: toll/interleukin-1 receptor domain-containing protein [Proteobacteria bacterium]|nr:toll/interleukin-1 receptor domain-containing protein [Pseudomonadota bacterium]
MAKVVFSYSHVDEQLRNELEKHLSPLKRLGRIETWHDRRIVPGEEFDSEIDQHFAEADIVLLLVSPDFIASDYCYEIEMTNSIQRHECGEATVIPVILRPCAWKQLPFGKLLAATPGGKAIVTYTNIDDGFVEVVNAVTRALDELGKSESGVLPTASLPGVEAQVASMSSMSHTGSSPRSSNMAIRKEFTDRDRDLACKEGFDYLSRFFANSLEELSTRNPELETDFRQRDADSFECSIYQNGKRISHCGIWRNSGSSGLGDICYSSDGISANSWNDSMSVDSDGAILGFTSLMGGMMGQHRDALLTAEGMAEHFWEQLLCPLK